MAVAPATPPSAVAPASKPERDKRRRRYQPKPPAPPSFATRCITYTLILATVAVVFTSFGLTWIAPLPLLLSTLPLYCLTALQFRRIFRLTTSGLKGTEESRREAGVVAAARVRNPRCYLFVVLARPIFAVCAEGILTSFFILALTSFQHELHALPQLCAGGVLLAFSSICLAYVIISIALLVLHLFDFIQAQPDVAQNKAGRPMPGTPASRRWVLGLRRITGFLLYGGIALLFWAAASSGIARNSAGFGNSFVLMIQAFLGELTPFALYAAGALLLAVVPLALLQFVLIATCFCRFSLRSIFLLQAACGALISLTCTLAGGWKAIPIVMLLCLLTRVFFYVVSQDPESAQLYTPDFIRQRLIQRRAQLRERLKAQAARDAQPVSAGKAGEEGGERGSSEENPPTIRAKIDAVKN